MRAGIESLGLSEDLGWVKERHKFRLGLGKGVSQVLCWVKENRKCRLALGKG